MKGKCFCGSVEYTVKEPVDSSFHCHCESCRRSHGSAFVTWASLPYSSLSIQKGESLIKAFESSLNIFWGFCSVCGSSLFQRTHRAPKMVYVSVATLTDPIGINPDSHMCISEQVDWFQVNDGLKSSPGRGSDLVEGN